MLLGTRSGSPAGARHVAGTKGARVMLLLEVFALCWGARLAWSGVVTGKKLPPAITAESGRMNERSRPFAEFHPGGCGATDVQARRCLARAFRMWEATRSEVVWACKTSRSKRRELEIHSLSRGTSSERMRVVTVLPATLRVH